MAHPLGGIDKRIKYHEVLVVIISLGAYFSSLNLYFQICPFCHAWFIMQYLYNKQNSYAWSCKHERRCLYIYLASLINYWIPLKSFTLPTYKLRLINMILFSCTLSIAMKSEVKDMKTSQKGLNNLLYVMLHLCVNDTILCFLYMISVFCSCIFNLLISKFFYV